MSRFLVCINDNRLHEVGIAILDLDRPCELSIMAVSDTISYTKTICSLSQLFPPAELLLPRTATESALRKALAVIYEDVEMVLVARKYFNESSGATEVERLMGGNEASFSEICSRYLCSAAAYALLKYVEFKHDMVFANHSLRFRFFGGPKSSLHIDINSLRALEVINSECGGVKSTLFGVLNRTSTSMGERMLRINLSQPPSDFPTISSRLDCVEELCCSTSLLNEIGQALKKLRSIDLDRLISQLARVDKKTVKVSSASSAIDAATLTKIEATIVSLVALRSLFRVLEELANATTRFISPVFHAITANLFDKSLATRITVEIEQYLSPEIFESKGKVGKVAALCFAVKTGIDGLLDVSRKTYTEANEDAEEHFAKLKASNVELGSELKLHRNKKRGFFLSLPTSVAQPASSLAIELVKQQKIGWVFTTRILASISGTCLLLALLSSSSCQYFLLTPKALSIKLVLFLAVSQRG